MAPKMPVKSKTRSTDSSVHGQEQDMDRRMEQSEVEPGTRPICHDQLVIEGRGIYAGLESKCVDIDGNQTAAAHNQDLTNEAQLKNDQWQTLIALHKQLFHEHHDFFRASQHPAASPALSKLAAKYSMPARMWRHVMHAFLEVLRYRLPDNLDIMLAFIYFAYSMMALLFETVPAFGDGWIECLGDLGRYRRIIEDKEPRARETWSNVTRFWYNQAADKSPTIGRLHRHLAISARPGSLEQESLYLRALPYMTPSESVRGNIMTLVKPILQGTDAGANKRFLATVHELEKDGSCDKYITKCGSKLEEAGAYCADANIAALFNYGTPKQGRPKATLRLVYEDARRIREEDSKLETTTPELDSKTAVGLPNPDIEAFVLFEDDSIASRLIVSFLYEYARRVREEVARHHAEDDHQFLRAACKTGSSLTVTFTICANLVVPATARTIPRNTSNEESTGSLNLVVIPLAQWSYLAFVIITLLITQYLAHIKDPIFVWGCMMTVWAFGWWTIRADPGTTLSISVV